MFLLVEKLVLPLLPLPSSCLVYYRGKRYLPRGFPLSGALEVCGGFWGERLRRPVITLLSLLVFTGFARRHGCFSAGRLRNFGVKRLCIGYVDM